MKWILFFIAFLPFLGSAQKLKKSDKAILDNLKAHVYYLADDKLEGRRAGGAGELLAATYISEKFKAAGVQPAGDSGTFFQSFSIYEGRRIAAGTRLSVGGQSLKTMTDFFPLSFSANMAHREAVVAPSLSESGQPWFINIGDFLLNNRDNPHLDLSAKLMEDVKNASAKGASAIFFYNGSEIDDKLFFDSKDRTEPVALPVIYISKQAWATYFGDPAGTYDITYAAEIAPKTRTARNVIGKIDRGAASTIVIGAHYDHLGYGEDGNSFLRTGERQIHNGADDNASGTAVLIELGRALKKSKTITQNVVLIAFSAEELGLNGSKYFVEHPTTDLKAVNFMINMDMIGRLNDSSRVLTVGGVGTSPGWNNLLQPGKNPAFRIKVDSSGTGPSDHASFYRKDIPVLFFFTGLHSDYHRPEDDAEKINYAGQYRIFQYIQQLIEKSGQSGRLAFTRTREQQTTTSARFAVSMGIMPDYSFNGSGVRVDGVSEGRPAKAAGLLAGDIVTQLGDYPVSSVETYMQALSKFKKGDQTKVTVKRGNETINFDIRF